MNLRSIYFLFFLLLGLNMSWAQEVSPIMKADTTNQEKVLSELIGVLDQFFEGLHQGDSTLMKGTLDVKNLRIQTSGTNRAGNPVLINQTASDFLIAIASKKPEDVFEEKLLSYHYQIDGPLATVWTPYEFYFNGKFSHCGVNSFHFFNDGKGWKIIYLIDTRRRTNCK